VAPQSLGDHPFEKEIITFGLMANNTTIFIPYALQKIVMR